MKKRKVTLSAVGDILIHKRVYEKAKTSTGYDFSTMFSNVEHLFNEDEVIIVNQESIIAGEEVGLSDFPKFNSPIEIGEQLKKLNVDIVNTANNHTLDRGEKGVLTSLKNWDKLNLPYIGSYKSIEDQETIRVIKKNGLKIAFLSYTNSLSVVKRPKGKEYLVNHFSDVGVKWIRRLIGRIKSEYVADVVVLSIHFGKEYQMLPTANQIELSNSLADTGADVIIGHHPHVLQPPALLVNSKGKKAFVAYSLGNFFSGQKGLYRQTGAYLSIDIEKDLSSDNDLIDFLNPTMTLTYVDSTDKEDYKIHILSDLVAQKKPLITDVGVFDSQEVFNEMSNHLKQWMPNLIVK